jgi:hypothetical protein
MFGSWKNHSKGNTAFKAVPTITAALFLGLGIVIKIFSPKMGKNGDFDSKCCYLFCAKSLSYIGF